MAGTEHIPTRRKVLRRRYAKTDPAARMMIALNIKMVLGYS
jgi:hypothetical protein